MKKSLKDMTIQEMFNIMRKHDGHCVGCPLYALSGFKCFHYYCELAPRHKEVIKQSLDKEVDIDE